VALGPSRFEPLKIGSALEEEKDEVCSVLLAVLTP